MVKPLFGIKMVGIAKNEIPSFASAEDEVVFVGIYNRCSGCLKLGHIWRWLAIFTPIEPVVHESVLGGRSIRRVKGALLVGGKSAQDLPSSETTSETEFENLFGFVTTYKIGYQVTMTKIHLNRIHR